jgi:hypothetical protein
MALSNPRDPYGVGSHFDALHSELIYLKSKYTPLLKKEALQGDVECLTMWIEAYQQGSDEAAEYLQEYGDVLLENIHNRLKEASVDLQRMDEESPASKDFTGGEAHHLSRATALTTEASKEFESAVEHELARKR